MTQAKQRARKKPALKAVPQEKPALKAVPHHYYEKIQGWFKFSGAYKEMLSDVSGPATFVEVGCWKGRSAAFLGVEILKRKLPVKMICVDHFVGSDEEQHRNDPDLDSIEKVFRHNMQPCVDAGLDLEIIKSDSVKAAEKFEDGSVDFVWLDAAHDYDSAKRDIDAWLPKVKSGGFLGGDDLPFPGVAKAVGEAFRPLRIQQRHEDGWTSWLVKI